MMVDIKSLGAGDIIKVIGDSLDAYFHVNVDERTFVIVRIVSFGVDPNTVVLQQLYPRANDCRLCGLAGEEAPHLSVTIALFESGRFKIVKALDAELDIAVLTT